MHHVLFCSFSNILLYVTLARSSELHSKPSSAYMYSRRCLLIPYRKSNVPFSGTIRQSFNWSKVSVSWSWTVHHIEFHLSNHMVHVHAYCVLYCNIAICYEIMQKKWVVHRDGSVWRHCWWYSLPAKVFSSNFFQVKLHACYACTEDQYHCKKLASVMSFTSELYM